MFSKTRWTGCTWLRIECVCLYLFWLFQVKVEVNLGKDFTRDSVEIRGECDPGSYMAFAAMPLDIYARGLNDGLTEYRVSSWKNSLDLLILEKLYMEFNVCNFGICYFHIFAGN